MVHDNTLLEVKNLKKYFPIKHGFFGKKTEYVKAVDGISLTIEKGETLGFVGESGCGKTTTGKLIVRLLEATKGEVCFSGQNIFNLNKKEMRKIRREMQIVFQDPFSSLNPRMTVGNIVAEPIEIHNLAYGKKKEKKIEELLETVGLSAIYKHRYPREFSGGQRQRIGIARALALEPKFIVLDEPVSELDVSVQAQIINLLQDLQDNFKLTYFFIAHDLSIVKHISTRIAVMYLGKIVELADTEELSRNPIHPYTQALFSAIPVPNPEIVRKRISLKGDVPSPINPPGGCCFHTRCPGSEDICSKQEPPFKDWGNKHFVACHLR